MKTASAREVKSRFSHYLKEAEKEDILVTSYGKPCAVLHGLSGGEVVLLKVIDRKVLERELKKLLG